LLASFLLLCLSFSGIGCGSGSGSGGGSPTPDFTLSATPTALTLNQGGTVTFTVYAGSSGGFAGDVQISFAGLPAGVMASPATLSLTAGATQTISLSADSSAALGSATLTVTGASGSLTHTASVAVNVIGPAGFTILAPGSLTVVAGASQTATISVSGQNGFSNPVTISIAGLPAGVTVSQSSLVVVPGSSQLLSFTAAAGSSGSGVVVFTGASGTLSATAQTALSISTVPDFTISTDVYTAFLLTAGTSSNLTIGVTGYNGFMAPVAIALSGLPTGVSASPASFSVSPGQTQQVTISSTLATSQGSSIVTVSGSSGGLQHTAQFQFQVTAPTVYLSVQPTALTIDAGGASSLQVGVDIDGNNSTATGTSTVSVTGLPAGITASPSSATFSNGGGGVDIYLTAAASGASGGTFNVTATYAGITQTVPVTLTVGAAASDPPVTLKSRSKYIRTDSTTDFGALPEPTLTLYHAATNRFFSSDPDLGHLNVVDAATQTLTATLNIPGAFGIDQSPDGGTLYVGTFSGDLYVVDPVGLAITKRYASSSISQYGFAANAVFALADGKLLLMQYFLVPYYSWVDGNGPLAVWNPADNSIVELVQTIDGKMPEAQTCFQNFEHVILTANRSRVIITPTLTSEGTSALCSLDPEAGTWNLTPTTGSGSSQSTAAGPEFASSPDGKTVVTFDGVNVYVLDSTTLAIENSFPAPSQAFNFMYPKMLIGPDNNTLYIDDPSTGTVLRVYNMTTGALIGWLPEVEADSSYKWYEPSNPQMQAMSADGQIAGVLDNGLGLLDSTAAVAPPIGTTFGFSALQTASGPTAGGTLTSWVENQSPPSPSAPLGSVYFGAGAGSDLSYSDSLLYAKVPAGSAGPVDVSVATTDGGEQMLPDGYSYGPWLLQAPTSYATAEGGGPGQVYGYGFGPVALLATSGPYGSPPAGLSVSVGGQSATVTGFVPAPYQGSYPTSTQPFPLQGAEFTVPPGAAGTTAPIAVTSSSGKSAGQAASITYLPAVQQYPASGSQLVDGVYDPLRDVYYFTDATRILVFSRTQGQWLSPIPIPAPASAAGLQRLYGIALSPDRSKLAVTDAGALAVYVLDPGSPTAVTTYSVAQNGLTATPAGVAIANDGTVYFTTFDQNGDGAFDLYFIDPASGQAGLVESSSGYPIQGDDYDEVDLRLQMSADGSQVYFCNDGQAIVVDTATNTASFPSMGPLSEFSGGFELALSPDQTRMALGGLLLDSTGLGISFQTLGWESGYDADYVYGVAFSSDGTVLFQPGVQAIDAYDGVTGAFLSRISLPMELSPNYRALVSDSKDNTFVAITGATGNGVAVLDLEGVARPAPKPYGLVARTQGKPAGATSTPTGKPARWQGRRPFNARMHRRILPGFRAGPQATPLR
jgi:hypothetical protein